MNGKRVIEERSRKEKDVKRERAKKDSREHIERNRRSKRKTRASAE